MGTGGGGAAREGKAFVGYFETQVWHCFEETGSFGLIKWTFVLFFGECFGACLILGKLGTQGYFDFGTGNQWWEPWKRLELKSGSLAMGGELATLPTSSRRASGSSKRTDLLDGWRDPALSQLLGTRIACFRL